MLLQKNTTILMAINENLVVNDEELKSLPNQSFSIDTGLFLQEILFGKRMSGNAKVWLTEIFIICLRYFIYEKEEDK